MRYTTIYQKNGQTWDTLLSNKEMDKQVTIYELFSRFDCSLRRNMRYTTVQLEFGQTSNNLQIVFMGCLSK